MMARNFRIAVLAAAALGIGAVAGYGDDYRLKANIGFPFRSLTADMPAGSYDLSRTSSMAGTPIFLLRDSKTHKSVAIAARYELSSRSTEPNPRLVFRCDSNTCGLSEIWLVDGHGWAAPKAKLTPNEKERIAVVPLATTKAD